MHLDEVRSRLTALNELERSLDRFVTACSDACAGGAGVDCVIFKDIAEPPKRLLRYFAVRQRRGAAFQRAAQRAERLTKAERLQPDSDFYQQLCPTTSFTHAPQNETERR